MKTVYGLFPSYRDARAALEEFHRQGFAEEDLSVLHRSGLPSATATGSAPAVSLPQGGKRRRPKKGERVPARGQAIPSIPSVHGLQPANRSEQDPMPPGGQRIDVGGSAPIIASGRLAAAISQAAAEGKAAADPKSVLATLGLPVAYAENYAKGVGSGQTLLAVRTQDDRERDVVMIMRRHRVASLGGLPE